MSNKWTMVITDSAQGGAVIGEYTLVFDDSRGNGGTLSSVTVVSGGAYNPADGTLDLTVAGGPMTMTIGKLGDPNGLTQFQRQFLADLDHQGRLAGRQPDGGRGRRERLSHRDL